MRGLFLILVYAAFNLLLFSLSSCSSDDCSDISEWIATYDLQSDSVCATDTTFSFTSVIELEASSIAETFQYEGEPFTILDCTATDGFFTMTKDSNDLTVTINGTGCSWEFRKR